MNPKAENRIAVRRRQSVGRAEQIACQAAGEDAWTSSLLGTGQKCFKARCASKHSAKSFSPVPLHCERAARRTKGSRSGTPREKETSPGGAGKAERGGTRPPSPRTGGEADEGQPKRHPVREGDFSRRGRKAERGGTRPPSLRTGGEADEGQPKRHPAREGDFSRRGRKSRERRHPSPFTTNGRRGGRRAAEAAESRTAARENPTRADA